MADAIQITYEALTPQDRLGICQEQLRAQEDGYYRLWLTAPDDADRLNAIAAQVERLQAEYNSLKSEITPAA